MKNEQVIKLSLIKNLVEEITGENISGNGKTRGTQSVADARRLFIALIKRNFPCTLQGIADFLNIKTHASIIHLNKDINYIIENNNELKEKFYYLLGKISNEDNIFTKTKILILKKEYIISDILDKQKELSDINEELEDCENKKSLLYGYSKINYIY